MNHTGIIEEVEKIENGIPIRNIWYMLLYVIRATHLINRWKSEVEKAPNLDALLAGVLSEMVKQRIRTGLGRDYCRIEKEISGIRGRVNFNKSLKKLSLIQGRTCSRYQIYSRNVFKNQILRSTLARVGRMGNFGSDKVLAREYRDKVRSITLELKDIDIIDIKLDLIRREQLKEKDRDYRLMLSLCYILNRRLMPMEKSGSYSLPKVNRDELTLYAIYEKFVAEFYRDHLQEWVVRPQRVIRWPFEGETDYMPAMKPDLLLEHKETGKIIILDTKFTRRIIIKGQYDSATFNSSHLYQMYSYLRSQEGRSNQYQSAVGLLLYPSAKWDNSEEINIQGHTIRWETVDLAGRWEEIEKELLELIA